MSDNGNPNVSVAALEALTESTTHSHVSAEAVVKNGNGLTSADVTKSSVTMAGTIDAEKPVSPATEKAQNTSTTSSITDDKITENPSKSKCDVGEASTAEATSATTMTEEESGVNSSTEDPDKEKTLTTPTTLHGAAEKETDIIAVTDEKEDDDTSITDKTQVTGISSGAAVTSPVVDVSEDVAAVQHDKDTPDFPVDSPVVAYKSIFGGPVGKHAHKVDDKPGASTTTTDTNFHSVPALDKGKEPAQSNSYDFSPAAATSDDHVPNGENQATAGFVDIDGEPVNDETPPSRFEDWIQYLVFCEQGAQVRCEFGFVDEDGNSHVQKRIVISKKLLSDFSSVFKRMFSGPWIEAENGTLFLDDVEPADFYRLIQVLKSGIESPHINLGKQQNILSNLCKVYILADRYLMAEVKHWVQMGVMSHLGHLSTHWRMEYERDTVVQRSASAEEFHRAQVMDISATYTLVQTMGEDRAPIQLTDLATFAAFNCPRKLLRQMWGDVDENMAHEMGYHLVK